jgi:ribosomal protein S1
MAKRSQNDVYKEKFRADDDVALDKEIDAALSGMSDDDLYGDKEKGVSSPAKAGSKQTRRGKIVQIDKDDIFVDFGGKSQGIVSRLQFVDGEEPTVGQEMEFLVDRYDPREGLLMLSRRGAMAQGWA